MGLFLAPFSGHAVGGGGHGVIDPPPPGSDPLSGPRQEVGTIGRAPLRLLRTTMNKHKPKFMKVVPPGMQRGSIAPPYTWDSVERDDWKYNLDKPDKLREGEFDAPKPPALGATTAAPPRPGGALGSKDPRHDRVDVIHNQLASLRAELKGLIARRHMLVQQGKKALGQGAGTPAPTTSWAGSKGGEPFQHWGHQRQPEWRGRMYSHPQPKKGIMGPLRGRAESLCRSSLRLIEADYTPRGIARRSGDPPPPLHTPAEGPPRKLPNVMRSEFLRSKREKHNLPTGLTREPIRQKPAPPSQSPQIIQVHQQIQQKHAQIGALVDELKRWRMQLSQSHESIGLGSNNRRRLGLLLK